MWLNWLTYIQVLKFYQLTSQCTGETVLKTLIPLKEDLCNTSKCQISLYWVISTVESFEGNAILFPCIEFAPIFQDDLHLKPAIDKEQDPKPKTLKAWPGDIEVQAICDPTSMNDLAVSREKR